MTRRDFWFWAVVVQGGVLLFAVLLGAALGYSPSLAVKGTPEGWFWGLLGVVPMAALMLALRWSRFRPFEEIWDLLQDKLGALIARMNHAEFLGLSLCAGVSEEFLFRGVLQAWWSDRFGPVVGILGASVLFGLCHAVTFWYFVLAAIYGLHLGWLWYVSGDLLAPVIAHTLYDFAAFSLLAHESPSQIPSQIPSQDPDETTPEESEPTTPENPTEPELEPSPEA